MVSALITKRLVDASTAGDQDKFLWDRDVAGFGLKISPRGRKVYVLQYRMSGRGSPTKRFTIGKHGAPWTPDSARKRALQLLHDVRCGIDPGMVARDEVRSRHEQPFDQYLELFLELHCKRQWSPRTLASAESNLRRYVLPRLNSKPMALIDRRDVVAIMDAIPKDSPALTRSVFAHTRRLFSWAVERGDLKISPFQGLKNPPPTPSRERVLNQEEISAIWVSSQQIDPIYGVFVRLLLLTGQRRSEVAGMEWAELDLRTKVWTIAGRRTKNRETHTVPLTPEMIRELSALDPLRGDSNQYVFVSAGNSYISAFSSAKKQLEGQMRQLFPGQVFPNWRFHDLRRTFATGMQRLGVRFEVTEALLNHVSGAKSGVAGVYQRHDWAEEKRAALQAWSSQLAKITVLQH